MKDWKSIIYSSAEDHYIPSEADSIFGGLVVMALLIVLLFGFLFLFTR